MSGAAPGVPLLRELLAALPHFVLLVDRDRRIRYLNRTEVGYTLDDALGVDALQFIAPEAGPDWVRHFEQVLATGEAAPSLTWATAAHGESAWYEANYLPIVREGRVAYVGIIARNVTERVLAERDLALLKRLLPICDRCKRVKTEGRWTTVEAYLEESSRRRISHGICPDCEERLLRGEPGREPTGSPT